MIGHYSSVGVIKYTEKPEISIEGMQAGAYNRHQYIYTGVYSQKDKDYTEKVSTYRFKVYDLDNNVLADTGDLIHDISKDSNDTPYESYDSFEFTKELVSGETCKIQYEITTVNGLHIKTPKYKFVQGAMVKPALDAILTTEVDNENAYVKLGMFGVSNSGDYYYHKDSTELIVTGNFIVSRQRVNEPGNWKELTRFGLYAEKPSTWTWKDCTAEQGVSYIYSIQQYSETITSDRIVSKIWDNNKKIWADGSIYVNFEHAFLFDGERQLKIKYNPKISSFKTTLQESKLETMGSKYPFVFRNGRIGYKEFPISGLISCLMDEENLFMIDSNFKEYQNYEKQYDDLYRYSTKHSGNRNQVSQLVLTSLEDYNIKKEREFKLAVLDWLNNGKPKLFRSPTEGNYIVRLMNCSLSPNDTLGRMLHTFSCTAYEIASYDDKTLLIMGLTGSNELAAEREVEYITTEELLPHLINYNCEDEWKDNILDSTRKPTNIKFYNMVAGDKIKLITKDSEQVIIIGATGAYAAEGLTQINMIKLHKNNAKVQGMLTYNYVEKLTNEFGLYKSVSNKEIPIRQFIGGVDSAVTNIRKQIEDIKTELIMRKTRII